MDSIYKQYNDFLKPTKLKEIDKLITDLNNKTNINSDIDKLDKEFSKYISSYVNKKTIKLKTPIKNTLYYSDNIFDTLILGKQIQYNHPYIAKLKDTSNKQYNREEFLELKDMIDNKNKLINAEIISKFENNLNPECLNIYNNYKEFIKKFNSVRQLGGIRKICKLDILTKEEKDFFGDALPSKTRATKVLPMINMTISTNDSGTNIKFRGLKYWNGNTISDNYNQRDYADVKLEIYKIQHADKILEYLTKHKENIKEYIIAKNKLVEEINEKNNKYFVLNALGENNE